MADKEFFDALKKEQRERRSLNMQRADPTGWTQHSTWHWWRWLAGERLDYWPSKAKWMYQGKVSTGDVNAFIARREDGGSADRLTGTRKKETGEMANNITPIGARALSTEMAAGLAAGIQESRASTPIAGGQPLLRLLKSGRWVFGQTDDPVQEGSEWAVNPLSIRHGWSCWSNLPGNAKNELLGEVLAPISDRKPPKPEPVHNFDWAEERVFELKCLNGDDEGLQVLYKTSSVGGMRACDGFFAELVAQLGKDPSCPVAVLQLGSQSYQHAKWGEIFNPVFSVVDWLRLDGSSPDDDEGETEPAPAPVAAKPTRTRAATKPAPEQEPGPEPEPEVAPVVAARASAAPRRQRPAGRAN